MSFFHRDESAEADALLRDAEGPAAPEPSDIIDQWKDPRHGLTGVNAFAKEHHLRPKDVREALLNEDAYSLNHPQREKFARRPVVVAGVDSQWVIDLMDLTAYRDDNSGFGWILVCVDAASRYAWVRPLIDKSAAGVWRAFDSILGEGTRVPNYVQCDQGNEFATLKKELEKRGIEVFHTTTTLKAALAEAFNRTLKMRISKLWTSVGGHRWLEGVDDIVAHYNDLVHSGTGFTPNAIVQEPWLYTAVVLPRLEDKQGETGRPKFKLGDVVRVASVRHRFERATDDRWSYALYRIRQVMDTHPTTYRVALILPPDGARTRDYPDMLYAQQLLKVPNGDERGFHVETVLRRRTRQGVREEYVHWLGYHDEDDCWVPAAE